MKSISKNKKQSAIKDIRYSSDHISPDTNADKTGTDVDSDCTEKNKGVNKFDKPKREVDPDTTGIDINSDKTVKGKPHNKLKKK